MSARQQLLSVAIAVALVVLLSGERVRSSYCWDRQTETYKERFQPAACSDACTVTPFFSPDTSIYTYVDLIEKAAHSIDVYTPSK